MVEHNTLIRVVIYHWKTVRVLSNAEAQKLIGAPSC